MTVTAGHGGMVSAKSLRAAAAIGEPLSDAGLKRNSPLDGPSNRNISVAGRLAVAIASRSSRTGFAQAPGCGETCLCTARKRQRMRLGR